MSIFLLLLIFFLGYFVIWPLLKAAFVYRKIKKNFFSQFSDRQQDSSKPKAKKKIIDPSVGEYVAFEEIEKTNTSYSETVADSETTIVNLTESQTVDTEWEDI